MRLGCTGSSSTRSDLRQMAETLLSCIAGCAGVSGRGYYTAGPALDVPGRPAKEKPSLYVQRGHE